MLYLEGNTDPKYRSIVRCVLRLEDISRNDSTEGTSHYHTCHGKSLFILADHIVVLISPLSGNIANDSNDAEKYSAVSGIGVCCVSNYGDPDDIEQAVEE